VRERERERREEERGRERERRERGHVSGGCKSSSFERRPER
jgi:hypothetical protein